MKQDTNIKKSLFRFKNFFIEESSIKMKPKTGTKIANIKIKIKPKGFILIEKKIFELHLFVELLSEDKSFEASVKIIGFFEFKDVINIKLLNNYFYTNAPAILFPYLRSYISALTALSGMNTINIPPMNMTSMGQELMNNTKEI